MPQEQSIDCGKKKTRPFFARDVFKVRFLKQLIEGFCVNVCKFYNWLYWLSFYAFIAFYWLKCYYTLLLTICVILDFNRNVLLQYVSLFHKKLFWFFKNFHFYQCGFLFQIYLHFVKISVDNSYFAYLVAEIVQPVPKLDLKEFQEKCAIHASEKVPISSSEEKLYEIFNADDMYERIPKFDVFSCSHNDWKGDFEKLKLDIDWLDWNIVNHTRFCSMHTWQHFTTCSPFPKTDNSSVFLIFIFSVIYQI